MTIKHDNCKNCSSRCIHAGKDRDFVCVNGVSCKITTEKPQTNADLIRKMSDEELAEHIVNVGWDCHFCAEHLRLDNEPLIIEEKCDERCAEHCLEWLQQTAKG